MRKKIKNDDDLGVSLLNARLRGEKIDDEVIDDLLITDEERKANEKIEKEANKNNSKTKRKKMFKSKNESNVTEEDINTAEDDESQKQYDYSSSSSSIEVYNESFSYDSQGDSMMEMNQNNDFGLECVQGFNDDSDIITEEDKVISNVVNDTYNMMADRNCTKRQTGIIMRQTQAPATKIIINTSNPRVGNIRKRKETLLMRILKKSFIWAAYIAIIIAFSWAVNKYIIGVTNMVGNSMSPTYYDNETLLIDKISINFKSPELDDVIVFDKNSSRYIARIAGVPGDTIGIDINGDIVVNGKYIDIGAPNKNDKLFEIEDDKTEIKELTSEIKLNRNEFYVVSDNIAEYLDSRNAEIGVVNKKDIYGIVLLSFDFDK